MSTVVYASNVPNYSIIWVKWSIPHTYTKIFSRSFITTIKIYETHCIYSIKLFFNRTYTNTSDSSFVAPLRWALFFFQMKKIRGKQVRKKPITLEKKQKMGALNMPLVPYQVTDRQLVKARKLSVRGWNYPSWF